MDSELYELLTDRVYISYSQGKDTHGNPVYGAAQRVLGKIDTHTIERGGPPGHDELSPIPQVVYTVYLNSMDTDPGIQDKLTLNGDTAYITSVAVQTDERGLQHYIVTASKVVTI